MWPTKHPTLNRIIQVRRLLLFTSVALTPAIRAEAESGRVARPTDETPQAGALPWERLLPEVIRLPASVAGMRNPFSPVLSAATPSEANSLSEMPEAVAQRVHQLASELRACLSAPSQLALIGSRVYRPGDEIVEPRGHLSQPRTETAGDVRIVLQRVEDGAATLLVVARARDGSSRQHEMVLRARGEAGAKNSTP